MFVGKLEKNDASGAEVLDKTSFSVIIDSSKITFRITCFDKEPCATMTEYNQPLYDEEVCEVFLCPDGKGTRYLELEFNHLGTAFGAWIDNVDGQRTINFIDKDNFSYIVKNGDGVWLAEVEIPLSLFEGVNIFENGTFNVYRIKRPKTGWVLTAFSPTGEDNFHMPHKFAKISILKEAE